MKRDGGTKRERSLRARARSLGRRLSYRARRHLLGSDFLVARERRFGLRFRFKTEDAVGRRIYQDGVYEEDLTRFLADGLELRPGDVVVDAGANIGWYSLLLDRLAPAGVTIYAFEPDPLNFELLAGNLERNGAAGVVPVRKALDEREGRRPLFLYPDKNRGRHSLVELPGAEGTVEVPATTLARFWKEREVGDRPLRLLKVDVEGFELRALRGAGRLLDRCGLVVTEYVPDLLRRAGTDPGELLETLAERGFEPRRAGAGGLEPADPGRLKETEEPADLVWVRSEDAGLSAS